MIVKKVKADRVKSKAAHIRDLTDYLLEPGQAKGAEGTERVLHRQGRNFLCDDLISQQAEMVALASEAVRSRNPVSHYILSWREGEQPTPKQADEAVAIFLDEQGLSGHQVLYALHSDTDNVHLHLAVNRVHPETLKVIKPNKGFDIEAAHRAIARIEHAQGWRRERHGRYRLRENGELARQHQAAAKREPEQRKRDMEQRTGEKSAERIAIEEGAAILRAARRWEDLHERLAERGMRLEKKGSGALLYVGDVPVKASRAGRDCSFSALEKRLGAYRPGPGREPIAPRQPEPIHQGVPGWPEYIRGRKAHYAAKAKETEALRQRHQAERTEMLAQQKDRRGELLGGNWKGQGEVLNALRSVTAAEQAGEKAALRDKQQGERAALRARYRPFPDLETFLRQRSPELAEAWRYRQSPEESPAKIIGERDEPARPRDIRAFMAAVRDGQVHYRRADGSRTEAAFVDLGKHIAIADGRDRDSVLAALQLAAQKWGSFSVSGQADYKALCTTLAAEHGFKIANPELQGRIQEARRNREERTPEREIGAPRRSRSPGHSR